MTHNEILDDGLDEFLNEFKDVKPIEQTTTLPTAQQKNTFPENLAQDRAQKVVVAR